MPGSGKPTVLFLCTANSARSQMACALARHLAGDVLDVYSAGLEPKPVSQLTRTVLEEMGIDASTLESHGVDRYLGSLSAYYLIVVCREAEDRRPPTFPGAYEYLYWPFEDPTTASGTDGEKLEKFREVRDQIAARLDAWISEHRPGWQKTAQIA